jgi:FolB domain-containing protein
MDRILISDLLVRSIVGINDDERREKQDVLINLALFADLEKAGKSDRFEDAMDYRAVKKKVMALAENSRFFLVEALAEAIASLCLEDPRVKSVQVRVEKPTALRFARSVGVEITRNREKTT